MTGVPVLETVMLLGHPIIVGALTSVKVIVCKQDADKPLTPGYVAVHVLCMFCAPAHDPVPVTTSLNVTLGEGQLAPDEATAVPNTDVDVLVPIHTVLLDGQLIVGLVLHVWQLTLTLKAQVDTLPQMSVAE